MTPLAHRIVKELTLPKARRTFLDQCGVLSRMDDIHCFEVSAVTEMANDLCQDGEKFESLWLSPEARFLPGPKTWLEFEEFGERVGILLEDPNDDYRRYTFVVGRRGQVFSLKEQFTLPSGANWEKMPGGWTPAQPSEPLFSWLSQRIWRTGVLLSIINAPRIIGRRQHMPHRGLERALLKQQKLIGKFPLHAWTEIKLEVTPPEDARDDPSIEAHYTGKKALHFCRAHLRIVRGQLVFVKAHWRGDPALGMKQSRYKVVLPKGGA